MDQSLDKTYLNDRSMEKLNDSNAKGTNNSFTLHKIDNKTIIVHEESE